MNTVTNTQRGIFIALACAVIFGVYPAAIRAVYADGANAAFVIIITTWARAGLFAITFGTFYSIAQIGAFRCSLLLKMEPVFTALFSFLLLGEILKPIQYAGMIVVLISLATYQIMDHRNKEKLLKLTSC